MAISTIISFIAYPDLMNSIIWILLVVLIVVAIMAVVSRRG